MPLTRISLRHGKTAEFRKGLIGAIHRAMHSSFDVPEENCFMVIDQYDESCFAFSHNYLGIERSDDLIIIEISAMNSRSAAQKLEFYAEVARFLEADLGVRPEDVFINLVEGAKENWSLGNGLAQYA